MTARPYRLRVLLDVELTEQEWGILSQAHLPEPPPERRLVLLVVDETVLGEDCLSDTRQAADAEELAEDVREYFGEARIPLARPVTPASLVLGRVEDRHGTLDG